MFIYCACALELLYPRIREKWWDFLGNDRLTGGN